MSNSIQLGPLDLQRPPLDVLLAKYNAINSLNLLPSDFTLGQPVVDSAADHNTKIQITPNVGSIWLNSRWLYYKRVSLETLLRIPNEVRTAGNPFLHDILDAVNSAYGIYLQEGDVEQAVITYVTPGNTSGPGTVVITTRATSVFYLGTITIPVNTTVRQGLNTYDDEVIYYVQTSEAGKDSVRAYNIRGEAVSNFTPFAPATVTASTIKHFELLASGTLLLIGDFTYTITNGFGETQEFTRRVLRLNPFGVITDSAAGNVFGATYDNLQRFYDSTTGAMVALDPNNMIGGRANLTHRFTPEGAYDNAFQLGLTRPVTHLAVHAGFIYAAVANAGKLEVTKHNSTTGAVVPAFTKVVLSWDENLEMHAMQADATGVRLLINSVSGDRSAVSPVKNNNVALWTPGPVSAAWFPVLGFSTTGVPTPAAVSYMPGLYTAFTGDFKATLKRTTLTAGWFLFSTISVHPYYGRACQMVLAVSPTGEVVRSPSQDPKQAPIFTVINSVSNVENGDVVVCGQGNTLDSNLETVTGCIVAVYNRMGEVATTLVKTPETTVTFKKVAGRVP